MCILHKKKDIWFQLEKGLGMFHHEMAQKKNQTQLLVFKNSSNL